MTVVSRVLVFAAIVAAGTAAAAQTLVPAQLPPDAQHQAQVFEASLRAAIDKAGGDMLKRAKEVVPDISLRFETEIRVYSAIMPNGEGFTFIVDVPPIEATSLQLWGLLQRMPQSPNAPRVANPVNPAAPPMNPDREYSEFTRQALVDAMLDNAFALPLKEGQRLTVVVGEPGGAPSMEISQPPKKLYLSIKKEDLAALRENRIDRDEARRRIEEKRY